MTIDINWQSVVFESGWLEKCDKLAEKRFGKGGLAEEAASYVIEQISADDWSKLQSFKGQSKPETYLYTLAGNFLEEFARKRFGRPRPPEWLKRQGDIWIQVWKLICLERQMVQSVIDRLTYHANREIDFIKNMITTIKARIPTCGESNREISLQHATTDDETDNMADLIADNNTPDETLSHAYYSEILLMISSLFCNEITDSTFGNKSIKAANSYTEINLQPLNKLREKIDLTDEERLLLKMVFQDGLKKSIVAKSLGMQSHMPGRIIRQALDRISTAMQELGINIAEIKGLCAQ